MSKKEKKESFFRRSLRRWLRAPGRRLEITKAGWLFIVITLAVGFAAINSGSNLLHGIFGSQLGIIVASGALSETMVHRAQAHRRVLGPLHAGQRAPVEIEVLNTNGRRPLFSVSVEDDDESETSLACRPIFSLALGPGKSRTLSTTVSARQRGRHELPGVVIATRFPFGLFVKRKISSKRSEILVYPRIHSVEARHEFPPSTGSASIGGSQLARAGEFRSLDELREPSELRRVHWPATARFNRPMVREFEDEGVREHTLSLRPGQAGDAHFESEVEYVASQAVALLRDGDMAVGLRYGEQVIPPDRGSAQTQRLLSFLATVGFTPTEATA